MVALFISEVVYDQWRAGRANGATARASEAAGHPKSEIAKIRFYLSAVTICFFVLQGC